VKESEEASLTIFSSVDEAKSFFWSTDALSCVDTNTSQVQYQLVADGEGNNTMVKKTEAWDTSGIGDTYNTLKTNLINSNNWGITGYTTENSTDHLF